MEKAIATAKARHPKVKVLALGSYLVRGSAGNFYTVTCERKGGEKQVDCGCIAGHYGTECYHAAAALAVHTGLVRMRRAAVSVAGLLAPRQKPVEHAGAYAI